MPQLDRDTALSMFGHSVFFVGLSSRSMRDQAQHLVEVAGGKLAQLRNGDGTFFLLSSVNHGIGGCEDVPLAEALRRVQGMEVLNVMP